MKKYADALNAALYLFMKNTRWKIKPYEKRTSNLWLKLINVHTVHRRFGWHVQTFHNQTTHRMNGDDEGFWEEREGEREKKKSIGKNKKKFFF